ncbi:hypothetical protein QWJ34_20795 [Saccharibacillus sp. CPCC 101409]|uniref:hypothetical protein n=1 Tax=Saccharibacillus sp. CPCC 101409 TaxID=3058041 RepID=UPI002671B142|nr:hypothetical protein [Saccharibacillus sp. CPCC 101409]MDO3412214.1 hypothetical protein [Saccharibacillus sp. CPCC 101409]
MKKTGMIIVAAALGASLLLAAYEPYAPSSRTSMSDPDIQSAARQAADSRQVEERSYELASSAELIDLVMFPNIEFLKGQSDLIVVASRGGEASTYEIRTGSGEVLETLGKIPLKIERVLQGEAPGDSTVTLVQGGRVEDGTYHTLSGYTMLNDSDRYLLFLRRTGENTYAVNGSYQGKFNLSRPEPAELFYGSRIKESELKEIDFISPNADTLAHFNRLKRQALDYYAESVQPSE